MSFPEKYILKSVVYIYNTVSDSLEIWCPFLESPGSILGRKAIFSSPVSKNGEVYTLKLLVQREPLFLFRVCE